jgi:hypothetical protein
MQSKKREVQRLWPDGDRLTYNDELTSKPGPIKQLGVKIRALLFRRREANSGLGVISFSCGKEYRLLQSLWFLCLRVPASCLHRQPIPVSSLIGYKSNCSTSAASLTFEL